MDSARFTYGGTTPAADLNTYTLFNSITIGFGGGCMAAAGYKRLQLDLKNFYGGTLKQSTTNDSGTTWNEIDEETVGATVITSSLHRDYEIETYKDYKLEWINGGAAQLSPTSVPWSVTMALTSQRALAGYKAGPSPNDYARSRYRRAGTLATDTVKAAPGIVFSFSVMNRNAAARYFQIYDLASGTGTVAWEEYVPGNSTAIVGSDLLSTDGIKFVTGITWGMSTATNSYTAATASETDVQMVYL